MLVIEDSWSCAGDCTSNCYDCLNITNTTSTPLYPVASSTSTRYSMWDSPEYLKMMENMHKAQWILGGTSNWPLPKSPLEKRKRKNSRRMKVIGKLSVHNATIIFLIYILLKS